MAKAGRKPIPIDWEQFDKLCVIHCTLREIASWFGCSEDTIERTVKRAHNVNFAEYFEQKSAKGKISLRRAQFQNAMSGNVVMQIFLGKQKTWLGQTDGKQQVEQTITVKEVADMSDAELEEVVRRAK